MEFCIECLDTALNKLLFYQTAINVAFKYHVTFEMSVHKNFMVVKYKNIVISARFRIALHLLHNILWYTISNTATFIWWLNLQDKNYWNTVNPQPVQMFKKSINQKKFFVFLECMKTNHILCTWLLLQKLFLWNKITFTYANCIRVTSWKYFCQKLARSNKACTLNCHMILFSCFECI